jgi:ferrous iron transport protein A
VKRGIFSQMQRMLMTGGGASMKAQLGSPLGQARQGFCGHIQAIDVGKAASDLLAAELESRLIELGFIEGARVEVLHEGPFGRDPIAVRVNNATVALRRREAMAIFVTVDRPS